MTAPKKSNFGSWLDSETDIDFAFPFAGAAGVPQTLASISHCSFSGGVGGSAVFDAARTEPCSW